MKASKLKTNLLSDSITAVYLFVDLGEPGRCWIKTDKSTFIDHMDTCLYPDDKIFAADIINNKLYVGRD